MDIQKKFQRTFDKELIFFFTLLNISLKNYITLPTKIIFIKRFFFHIFTYEANNISYFYDILA